MQDNFRTVHRGNFAAFCPATNNKRVGGIFVSAQGLIQTQKTCPEFISGSRTKKEGDFSPLLLCNPHSFLAD
jgi:hypothetical protein